MIKYYLPRSTVADLLDHLRQMICEGKTAKEMEDFLKSRDVEPLRICKHNPYQDSCIVCAPRWGATGMKICAK